MSEAEPMAGAGTETRSSSMVTDVRMCDKIIRRHHYRSMSDLFLLLLSS